MGFVKEEMNSWYLMKPAPNLIGSCLVVCFFLKRSVEYLNYRIHAFCSAFYNKEVAELFLLEGGCISLSASILIVKHFSLNTTRHTHTTLPC